MSHHFEVYSVLDVVTIHQRDAAINLQVDFTQTLQRNVVELLTTMNFAWKVPEQKPN